MSQAPPARHRRSVPGSIRDAIRGLAILWSTQRNVRVHAIATVGVIAAAAGLEVSGMQWCVLVLSIGLVLVAEALNTAIEFLADAVHPDHHPLIGRAKDTAAAGVLLAAVTASVVGVVVFGPLLVLRLSPESSRGSRRDAQADPWGNPRHWDTPLVRRAAEVPTSPTVNVPVQALLLEFVDMKPGEADEAGRIAII